MPASGAPGLDGDRTWNKGFDTEDGVSSSERRGVQLGRKERKRVVLETLLANAVRLILEQAFCFCFTDSDIWTFAVLLTPTYPRAPPAIVDAPLH